MPDKIKKFRFTPPLFYLAGEMRNLNKRVCFFEKRAICCSFVYSMTQLFARQMLHQCCVI